MGPTRSLRYAATVVTAAILLGCGPASSALAQGSWQSRQVAVGTKASDALFGVFCPAVSLCVAIGSRGTIVTSTEPAGGAEAWRTETVAPGPYVSPIPGGPDRTSPGIIRSISCATAGMCAAVTFAGDLYTSADPAGGASTWHATDLDGDEGDAHLSGVSCPTATFCVAVAAGGSGNLGPGGRVVEIGSPLSPLPSLTQVQLDRSLDLQAVSCAGPTFCIAVARGGRLVVTTDPAGGAPAWREIAQPAGSADLESVACAGTDLCLAGDAWGDVLASTDAISATPHWTEAGTGPSVPITDISCPTASHCAAVDNNGDVVVSANPTGPTGSWTATSLIPFPSDATQGMPLNALFGVSCPAVDFCAAVGAGGLIFTSEDPFDAEVAGGGPAPGHAAPRRPHLRILRGDHFNRQSRTKGAGSRVTFRLRPNGRVQGFLCRLDRRRFHRCRSPLRVYARVGVHTLRARAIGAGGLRGPVASAHFAIRRGPAARRVSQDAEAPTARTVITRKEPTPSPAGPRAG